MSQMITHKSESDFNETIPHCASTNENPIEIYKILETKGANFTKEMIYQLTKTAFQREDFSKL